MRFFYSPSSSAFFLDQVHGTIPPDAVEISEDEYSHFLLALNQGKKIDIVNGLFVIEDQFIDVSTILDGVKNEVRILRDKFLSRVADIGAAAFAVGNTALANEVFSEQSGVRRKLLDITDDPALNAATTREEMEAAVLSYYAAIVENVSPELRGAFKELEK